ncbi:MAG: alpha-amylase family glycosyl hydrolase [Gemmatimonadales bacterium]
MEEQGSLVARALRGLLGMTELRAGRLWRRVTLSFRAQRGIPDFLKTILIVALLAPLPRKLPAQTRWAGEDEVLYHIFVRSFRDSNGDRQGDLAGIAQSLPYLKRLGVTSLLLTPVNPSPHYHNYFATSFEGVDPAFGDSGSFTRLVRAVHAAGLRIYLDEEIQYVTPEHPWWRETIGHPGSPYANYILYKDSTRTEPEPAFFGMLELPIWSGGKVGIANVNLLEPAVRDYFARLFATLADPNHDGRFEDGVDGFRIDHMMDDLDQKGKLTHLFERFWAPVFAAAKAVNPKVKIIAEQFDWGYGDDFLTRGGADMVFGFPIRGAIVSGRASDLVTALRGTMEKTPAGKGQVIFLENHDTDRAASLTDDPRMLRLAAALMLVLKGTPSIYYGQELGMRGKQNKKWGNDANDIPVREAFEWHRRLGGAGEALWYRETGEWWTNRYARDDDGVSEEEEAKAPGSLLAWYTRLIHFRLGRPELREGDQQVLEVSAPDMVAILRSTPAAASLVLVNLGETAQCVARPAGLPASLAGRLRNLLAEGGGAARAPGCLRVEQHTVAVYSR